MIKTIIILSNFLEIEDVLEKIKKKRRNLPSSLRLSDRAFIWYLIFACHLALLHENTGELYQIVDSSCSGRIESVS